MGKKKKIVKAYSVLLSASMILSAFPGITYANESVRHIHKNSCYCSGGEYLCGLEEAAGHIHDDSCYAEETDNTASDSDAVKKTLICGLEETEGHSHSESCVCSGGELICGLEETDSSSEIVTHDQNTNLVITGDATCEDDVWKLESGTYTVSETATETECLSISGDVTLTLDNASIVHSTTNTKKYAPAISIESGSHVTLELVGNNTVKGSLGCAGIYVSEGAELTITGDGTLNATGGDTWAEDRSNKLLHSAGAGIGGNGAYLNRGTREQFTLSDFGTINIEGGTIHAVGGNRVKYYNASAGAGIGSGGANSDTDIPRLKGTINISDGEIHATGGDGDSMTLTGGGAGIGSGGTCGDYWLPYPNDIEININGGKVTAKGVADGAGIGGGANVDSGKIYVTDGEVIANGGYEIDEGKQDGGYGGAGIGGGDNGGVGSITITGGTVVAKATGAAAGIGSGSDGVVGERPSDDEADDVLGTIEISGSAHVTAYGGSYKDGVRDGGAGIGAGRSSSYDNSCGNIIIGGEATVYAYAGAKADAIGVGSAYTGSAEQSLKIDDTVTLWAQTKDNVRSALLNASAEGTDPLTYESEDTYLLMNSDEDGKANGYLKIPGDSTVFEYQIDGLSMSVNGEELSDVSLKDPVGNWATFYGVPSISVSYQYIGIVPDGVNTPSEDSIKTGSEYTAAEPETVHGYEFNGWYTDLNLAKKYINGTVLNADTVLYGEWVQEVGSLQISNKVEDGDTNKEFSYKIKLNDSSINGTYGELEFVNGEASFTLKSEEKISIANLPIDIEFEISQVSTDGYTTTSTGAVGRIEKNNVSMVEFKNVKTPEMKETGSIKIVNKIKGAGSSQNDTFTYTIIFNDESVSGAYGDVVFENGTASFTLTGSEEKVISGLPVGVNFTISVTAPEGYQTESSTITGVISKDSIIESTHVHIKETPNPDDGKDDKPNNGSATISKSPSYGKYSGNYKSSSSSAKADNKGVTGIWNLISSEDHKWTFTLTNGDLVKDKWIYVNNPYASKEQPEYGWFHFDKDGFMQFGWYLDTTNDWYMLHDKSDGTLGTMNTNWYKDSQDKQWYYLDPNTGKMLTGWQYVNGEWYYLNPSAPEQTWNFDGTTWKYNGSNSKPYGSMYANEMTPDGYYVDGSGKWVK